MTYDDGRIKVRSREGHQMGPHDLVIVHNKKIQ